jgi:hypothetical protein
MLVWMVCIWSSSVIVVVKNDVLSSARLPKLFKRALVIAIPKPGKDGSDSAHNRLISLLSVMYKLLKRLIPQRIQPLIEAATPVNQDGFRKHILHTYLTLHTLKPAFIAN